MDVTLGGIAGLIAACAFLLAVGLLAYPIVKLGRLLDEASQTVRRLTDETTPILEEAKGTVTSVNTELVKLGTVTDDVANLSGRASDVANDASQLSSLVTSTIAGPLVKLSAFSYGVRRALASVRRKKGCAGEADDLVHGWCRGCGRDRGGGAATAAQGHPGRDPGTSSGEGWRPGSPGPGLLDHLHSRDERARGRIARCTRDRRRGHATRCCPRPPRHPLTTPAADYAGRPPKERHENR